MALSNQLRDGACELVLVHCVITFFQTTGKAKCSVLSLSPWCLAVQKLQCFQFLQLQAVALHALREHCPLAVTTVTVLCLCILAAVMEKMANAKGSAGHAGREPPFDTAVHLGIGMYTLHQ